MDDKSPDAFRNISEVSSLLNVPAHVLRFWETRFSQIKPLKRSGSRRYYRPDDIQLLTRIRDLLYIEGYTIKGALQALKSGVTDTSSLPEGGNITMAEGQANLPKILSMLEEARSRLDRLTI